MIVFISLHFDQSFGESCVAYFQASYDCFSSLLLNAPEWFMTQWRCGLSVGVGERECVRSTGRAAGAMRVRETTYRHIRTVWWLLFRCSTVQYARSPNVKDVATTDHAHASKSALNSARNEYVQSGIASKPHDTRVLVRLKQQNTNTFETHAGLVHAAREKEREGERKFSLFMPRTWRVHEERGLRMFVVAELSVDHSVVNAFSVPHTNPGWLSLSNQQTASLKLVWQRSHSFGRFWRHSRALIVRELRLQPALHQPAQPALFYV